MPYFLIRDFSAGLDLRKSPITAPAGTFRRIVNAHVTPGGEIEKRQAFVEKATLPAGCFGLAALGNDVWTFSNAAHAPTAHYSVQRLVTQTAYPLVAMLDYDIFDGRLYVVCQDSNGNIQHFYDGSPVADGKGRYVRTYRQKMHGVLERELWFSAVGNPADWSGTGSGFINLSTEDAESEELVGLEVYYDTLAVMSRRATQIWNVDPDPLKYQQLQVLRQAGTVAPLSVKQFGNGDILYLADSGVRSLQARDSSNAAAVSDIGSPVDPYLKALRLEKGAAYMAQAFSLVDPVTGRFWLCFPDRILVLSLFPSPRVTAWSTYFPEFQPKHAVVLDEKIMLLSAAGKLYAYGEDVYDNCEAEVLTPYMDADKPATFKHFIGFDAACEGVWKVYVRGNPKDETAEDYLGAANGPTFGDGRFDMAGHYTHVALRLTTKSATAARLGHLILHYEQAESG